MVVSRHEEFSRPNDFEKAYRHIQDMTLFLTPTWVCNRPNQNRICHTCLAEDTMLLAKQHGFQTTNQDTLVKVTEVTSRLPFKVALVGGEPLLHLPMFEATLNAIHPNREVTIYTNADFAFHEKQLEKVRQTLVQHKNRKIKLSLSAHDNLWDFKDKIEALLSMGFPVIAQLRTQEQETESNDEKKLWLRKAHPDVEIEEHDVAQLGHGTYGKTYKTLHLDKLVEQISPSGKSLYMYSTADGGTNVVRGDFSPYIGAPQATHLASTHSSPNEVVDGIVHYYGRDNLTTQEEEDAIFGLAEACYRSGTPVIISKEINLGRLANWQKFTRMYYGLLAEKNNTTLDQIKSKFAEAIAVFMYRTLVRGDMHEYEEFTMPSTLIASMPNSDLDKLQNELENDILTHLNIRRRVKECPPFSQMDGSGAYADYFNRVRGTENFRIQLALLDISKDDIIPFLDELVSRFHVVRRSQSMAMA